MMPLVFISAILLFAISLFALTVTNFTYHPAIFLFEHKFSISNF